MGYPMTYQRFLLRNQLADGDYSSPPSGWSGWWGAVGYVRDAFTEGERRLLDQQNERRRVLGVRLGTLAGDLRRLEADAADENAIARHVSARTGVDVEAVAAVLKEFVTW